MGREEVRASRLKMASVSRNGSKAETPLNPGWGRERRREVAEMISEDTFLSEEERGGCQLLTAKETARLLACSPQHVLRMALLGAIPAIDLAPKASKQRMWRFRRESILEWVEEREQGKNHRN